MANQTKEQVEKNLSKVLGGGVTQEDLDTWKQKYEQVHIVTVKLNENQTLTAYFRKPSRDVMANCINMYHDKKVFEAREFLLLNTFIGGDKTVTTNYNAAISAQTKLWASLDFLEAEATKY